jgi:23S rRNA pseudouridine1911/1915/1917 synthase
MKKITITTENEKERLDKFLPTVLDITRSKIQKLIKQSLITVNNLPAKSHYLLKVDDKIEIIDTEPKIESKRVITEIANLPEIEVIDNTDEFLIINKPAGLTTHGTKSVKGFTLVDALLAKFPELTKIGEDPDRPAIVHRLDKDVSGLMVIPKTQDSFDNIKNQFRKRTVGKKYTALVYEPTSKDYDEINFRMKRAQKEGHKMIALPASNKGEPSTDGKIAISYFEVIKRFINYTLIEVKIKTGRTHQIRVHLTAYGHPLVGDNLYNTTRTRELNRRNKLGRVFLAATKLSFKNLIGETVTYKLDLPAGLQDFLKKIK